MNQDELTQNSIKDGFSPLPENADAFARVPWEDGETFDFAFISEEIAVVGGLLPLPVRIVNGRHFGTGGGYGIAHILNNHAAAIALFGYYSVQDFVAEILEDFGVVYAGRDGRRLIVKRKDESLDLARLLVLELDKSKQYYSVVTGWIVSARRPVQGELIAELENENGAMVWKCRAPHSNGPG